MKLLSKKSLVIAGAVILVPIVALAWWLFSPLLFDKTVEEEFPFAATADVPTGMSRDEVETVMAVMAKMDAPAGSEADEEMAEPVALKTGQFQDADRFHKGSGAATLYRLKDGSAVLRLEDFRVTNGPALHVILTSHPSPSGRSEVHSGDYLDLGKLKGNVGNQNYPLPATADPSVFSSVVIYCKPFHVIFSVASLE